VRYLLDTNIVSDLVRHPNGLAARRILEIGDSDVCTSVVVTAELWFGAVKRGSPRLTNQLNTILSVMRVLPFEPPADRIYGHLRSSLEKSGKGIGGNDLLIAAQTIALGLTLVTDNEREFARIVELPIENWLR
jgi:tRNA(fMet)-specific endonuclease VapC